MVTELPPSHPWAWEENSVGSPVTDTQPQNSVSSMTQGRVITGLLPSRLTKEEVCCWRGSACSQLCSWHMQSQLHPAMASSSGPGLHQRLRAETQLVLLVWNHTASPFLIQLGCIECPNLSSKVFDVSHAVRLNIGATEMIWAEMTHGSLLSTDGRGGASGPSE